MVIRIYDAGQRNSPKSGYGLMAQKISACLEELGHTVKFFPYDGKEDVVLWIRPPHYIKYPEFNPKKKNVFFTMHELETFDGWKSDWPELLNKCDAVITPTEWNKSVFRKNGVKVPIYVVPLGVDQKIFHGDKDYNFSILTLHDSLGKTTSRENWQETLVAYCEAFRDKNWAEVNLTIKSYNIDYLNYRRYLQELKKKYGDGFIETINIVDIDLTQRDLNKLYAKHWLFVKNANREGWSLPLLQAMSCGMDVAFSNLKVFEWTEGYKKAFRFDGVSGLTEVLLDRFKHWKRHRSYINQFKWQKITEEVANVLKKA